MGLPYSISLGLAISLVSIFIGCAGLSKTSEGSCADLGTAILVDTSGKHLQLCQSGASIREFDIAIGRGGRDKHSQGDNRTPLGGYALGTPRGSDDFHLFIHVGYPTTSQRAQGYTGGDIGIHGPSRDWKWLGGLTTWHNWTKGCIAVGTDGEIEIIEKWVTDNRVKKVVLY